QDPTAATVSYTFADPDQVAVAVTMELQVSDGSDTDSDTVDLIIYNPDVTYVAQGGTGDGSAPDKALGHVQDGVAAATSTLRVAVAGGEYEVDGDPNEDGNDDDADNVTMIDGLQLVGGYEPSTWTSRDPAQYPSSIRDVSTTISVVAYRAAVVDVGGGVSESSRLEGLRLVSGGGAGATGIRIVSGDPLVREVIIESGAATNRYGI